MTEKRPQLTSAEIACTWTGFMNDSMAICVLGYFLKSVIDDEIRRVVQFTYETAVTHIEKLTSLYQKEGIPLPCGFTEEDVNLNAPRLYTDTFMLTYINHMAKMGLLAYSGFISMSSRQDVRKYFNEGLQETSDLFDLSSDVALSKGVFVRAPYIPYPTKTDFVDSKSYLSGFSIISKQRPLNAVEIPHLFMNTQTNLIGIKLSLVLLKHHQLKKFKNGYLEEVRFLRSILKYLQKSSSNM